MTFSDSIPIQFWLAENQTFNEKEVLGLARQDCFCQPVQCDDPITIHFTTDEYLVDGFEPDYQLVIVEEDDSILDTIPFVYEGEGETGHLFTVTFSMDAYSPCERKVAFRVSRFTDPGDREITGDVTDLIETVSGTIKNSIAIDGAITDLIEEVAATAESYWVVSARTKVGGSIGGGNNFILQYRINAGSWVNFGTTIYSQTTCEDLTTILVQRDDDIEFRCIRQSNSAAIYFNYDISSSCPINDPTVPITPSANVGADVTYSFTAYVNASDYLDV